MPQGQAGQQWADPAIKLGFQIPAERHNGAKIQAGAVATGKPATSSAVTLRAVPSPQPLPDHIDERA
ncbi:MAG: hypothetical protein IH971_10215 [Candidatus Marinimicrobia bacterium]|nr:hypothetical protein [Candidatus Neomarinimicrobiota bacterium]